MVLTVHRGIDPGFWAGKRVLVTGHTGFKGSWLSLWLQSLGAEVFGLALEAPTTPSLFGEARVADGMTSWIGDIRDLAVVRAAVTRAQPEIVLHLAAQPLVRHGYAAPVETYASNVMGTVHLLEAVREQPTVRACVIVTSDKCYAHPGLAGGFRESDPMGGRDPYSSSKGCAELVTAAYRASYLAHSVTAVATARAGNVIGGGDWSADRLLPDILRAVDRHAPVVIRHPQAIRPWQHVLDPLAGYLRLAALLHEEGQAFAEGWNFGPAAEDARSVQWIVEHTLSRLSTSSGWTEERTPQPAEEAMLRLDSTHARERLCWTPVWSVETALAQTLDWHLAWRAGGDARALCTTQIAAYTAACANV